MERRITKNDLEQQVRILNRQTGRKFHFIPCERGRFELSEEIPGRSSVRLNPWGINTAREMWGFLAGMLELADLAKGEGHYSGRAWVDTWREAP